MIMLAGGSVSRSMRTASGLGSRALGLLQERRGLRMHTQTTDTKGNMARQAHGLSAAVFESFLAALLTTQDINSRSGKF
jgi:hypothetical protein